MFKKLFGKKEESSKTLELVAPLSGSLVSLEKVPDPVFAEKMMGDGLAIDPSEGMAVSPVDGEIIQVFPTKHAIGIRAENGAEILLHIGLETVALKGEGFDAHVKEGDKVKAGDRLMSFDLQIIRTKAKSTLTPVIITNTDSTLSLEKEGLGKVEKGVSPIMKLTMK
ncbi:PTS glucose transporter subunit IIA [Mesobacillus zeae]|uniref:PTS glucose transporter subunit IIA n=1 Tax=Mesobacillus zeae TaxID=1917180 RepID=A0A398B5X8_9BACI|nr:PTS glucose transporter subunit IIA [Mesobacillus zeae]RID84218.1 PTS glucose transporter subunit IIA [Mesobacillus zeae]